MSTKKKKKQAPQPPSVRERGEPTSYRVVDLGIAIIEDHAHLMRFFKTIEGKPTDHEVYQSAVTWMQRRDPGREYNDYILRSKYTNDPTDNRCKAWAYLCREALPGNECKPYWALVSLYTFPEHRNQGWGTSLVNSAFAMVQARGDSDIMLNCRPANVHFYEGLGFAKVKRGGAPAPFVAMHRKV